jgi:hypothetical protein
MRERNYSKGWVKNPDLWTPVDGKPWEANRNECMSIFVPDFIQGFFSGRRLLAESAMKFARFNADLHLFIMASQLPNGEFPQRCEAVVSKLLKPNCCTGHSHGLYSASFLNVWTKGWSMIA